MALLVYGSLKVDLEMNVQKKKHIRAGGTDDDSIMLSDTMTKRTNKIRYLVSALCFLTAQNCIFLTVTCQVAITSKFQVFLNRCVFVYAKSSLIDGLGL
jgi:hypothetical protein